MALLLAQRSALGARDHAGSLRQAEHVEHQGDSAIAHDRRAGEDRDSLELLLQRLDDDLLGIANRVDDQSERAIVGLQHHDV